MYLPKFKVVPRQGRHRRGGLLDLADQTESDLY